MINIIISIAGLLGTILFALLGFSSYQIGMQFTGFTILFAAIYIMGTVGRCFQEIIKLQKETNSLLQSALKS